MKKVVCLVCLLAFSFSASFGQSENEIKYKWNKLNLITKFKSGVTATWSEYKGYSLTETGVGYGALRIKPESTQDIEDWCITRGNEKISESEFLSLIGKPEEAKRIEQKIDRAVGDRQPGRRGDDGMMLRRFSPCPREDAATRENFQYCLGFTVGPNR